MSPRRPRSAEKKETLTVVVDPTSADTGSEIVVKGFDALVWSAVYP